MRQVREVSGLKVAAIEHEEYFKGFGTASMYSVSKETGADVVLLLAEGKTFDQLTDEEIAKQLRLKG